jgi:hypothetical protein
VGWGRIFEGAPGKKKTKNLSKEGTGIWGRKIEGMNLTDIYCKHFCKRQNLPPSMTIIKKKKKKKTLRGMGGSCPSLLRRQRSRGLRFEASPGK